MTRGARTSTHTLPLPPPSRLPVSPQWSKRWRHREGEEEAEVPPRPSSRDEGGREREVTPRGSSTEYCRSSLLGFEAPGTVLLVKEPRHQPDTSEVQAGGQPSYHGGRHETQFYL